MKKLFFLLIAIVACWNAYATNVSGTIAVTTTWTAANSPYVVTASVTVNPGVTLTIESGVEVRFANGTRLCVYGGTLNATEVTFTSNTGTTAGLWDKIELVTGSTANLADINVMYAQYPIQLSGVCNFNISGVNSFADNTYQGVNINIHTVNSNFTLPKIDIPYLSERLDVVNGAKLTIAPGNILKFRYQKRLSVSGGSLSAIGTESEPILFTSIRDADAGGYTEAGGAAPGFWYGLHISNGDSTVNKLKYCTVKYGGNSYSSNVEESNIEVSGNAGVSITNCTIEKSKRALWIESGSAVKLTNSTLNGTEYPFAMRADAVLDVTGSNIDFTGTQYKAILLAGNAFTVNDAHLKVIPFDNAPNMAYASGGWIGSPSGKTLTIDPGVVIKGFTDGRIYIEGKLAAAGTTDNPIIFTSIHDDTCADPGDSNNNGVATSPSLGQWGGIFFDTVADNDSYIKFADFRYANYNNSGTIGEESIVPYAAIAINNVSPTIENCSFYEVNHGVKAYLTSTATVKNCTFNNVKLTPVAFAASTNLTIDNNTWGENIKYRALGLIGFNTYSNGTVKKRNDAGCTNLSYLLLDTWRILNGAQVTIEPGVVIKVCDNHFIHVKGGLKIAGTADERIVFTEMRDDNFGVPADTEGDGNASQPAINRWGGIAYYNGCDTEFSQINYTDFRYGGYRGLQDTYTYTSGLDPLTNANTLHYTGRSGVLTFSRTAVNVQNSTFFACGHGLAYYGPEATGLATNVKIENSDYAPIVQTWSAKPTFNNVEFVNNANQAIYLQDSRINYDVILSKTAGITGSNTTENAVYTSSNTYISTSANVQVSPGVIFKGTGFYVDGTLKLNGTAAERITLTSIHDDSKGGDTNNNGNATTPDKGNWHYDYFGITYRNTTSGNSVKFTDIAYTYHGIRFLNSTATVEDSKIEQCTGKGVSIQGTSNATIRRTAFNNLQIPVQKHAFSTASLHEGNTASNVSIMGIELIGETFNTSGTLPLYTFAGNTDITYWLTQTLTVGSASTLTIPAGASFKRNLDYFNICFNVKGTLNIAGTAEKPVVITDQRDDNYGSPLDFNQDGAATQNYSRYDKTFINFNTGSSGTLEHLVLKSNGYGLVIAGASPTLRNVRFDHLSRGVQMTGIGTAPVIENSLFNNTTYPLETSLLCFPASLAGNTFSGLSYKGIKVMNETLNQNVTLNPLPFGEMTNAPYIFDDYVVGAELTINPGVKCKFLVDKKMTVNRWLKAIGTADNPIVFTSIYDDYYGGDTNADGTATAASGSHWNGIQFADASIDADCQLKHVIVKNAYEAVTATGASPTLEYVTFYTNRNAVQATGASNPVISNCDFVGMSQRAVNNVNQSFTIQAQNCWWGSAEGPVVATGPSGARQAITGGVNVTPVLTTGLNQPLIGDVSANGTVQAYDASLVLQAAISAITLNPAQTAAADASGDGNITAYDATLILEYVAGINFNMPGSMKAPRHTASSLAIGSGEITHESDLLLPLALKDIPSSVGVDVVLAFNPALLQAMEIVPATNTGFMQATRIDNENGRIYFAAASTDGKAGDDWNMVRFRVSESVKTDFQTNISAELFRVNEKDETSAATAGTVIFRSPTGFDAADHNAEIRCFPNPATDVIYLSGISNNEKISIFNVSGQKVQTTVLTENKLNISSFSNGLYFIEIEHNGKVQKLKFLKK